jgi:hypothetical protein
MQRHKLNLDDIRVESFVTDAVADARVGTVFANDWTDNTSACVNTCAGNVTCDGGGTCYQGYTCGDGWTCNGCESANTACQGPTNCSPDPCTGPGQTTPRPTCNEGCESGQVECSNGYYTCDETCYQIPTCQWTGPEPSCCG